MLHKYGYLKSIFTWVVLVTFVSSNTVYAAPLANPAQTLGDSPVAKLSLAQVLQDPFMLDIPFNHVSLKEVHRGHNGKLIIHIQDAHSNLSGQQNLAGALDHLMKRYDIPMILVEGADREVSLSDVRESLPLEEWKRAAKRFLYDGVISGEEYLNLTTGHPMRLMGIEYADLYEENLEAYAGLVDRRKDILLYLYKIRVSLNRIKNKLYSDELLSYEKLVHST